MKLLFHFGKSFHDNITDKIYYYGFFGNNNYHRNWIDDIPNAEMNTPIMEQKIVEKTCNNGIFLYSKGVRIKKILFDAYLLLQMLL